MPEHTFSPPENLACLVRAAQGLGGSIAWQMVCYAQPPPPPPPYESAGVWETTGVFDEVTGSLNVTLVGCSSFFDLVALQLTASVQIDKASQAGIGLVSVLEDAVPPFDCADGTVTSGPLTLTPLPQTHDEDSDGCTDWEELGTYQGTGGLRDPFNYWDFMDVPTGPSFVRDKAITVAEISGVVARFGTNDTSKTAPINRNTDPLTTPPPAPAYHPAYDRGPVLGPHAWNIDAADGSISVADISRAVAQFGHNCRAPP